MVAEKPSAGGSKPARARLAWLMGAAVILAYFLRFAVPALQGGFAVDDAMNLHVYWSRGVGQLLLNLVLFPSNYGRPMGGAYYTILYHLFGLDPLPYHIATTCLLLLNTFLVYRFAVLITESRATAGFCALLTAYHPELWHLVYLPSFIYDVLCFTFFFLSLNYYLSIRGRGAGMSKRQIAVFLLLFIGALDSKEMAASLPALLLLYEAIWHPPSRWRLAELPQWARANAVPALLAGLVTLAFMLGKIFAPDSPMLMDGYRPVFTLNAYLVSTTRFLNQLIYQSWGQQFFNPARAVAVLALLFVVARGSRRRHMLWMWFFILIAPLPVTFIPGRGGGCLYIPLAGWALFAATLLVSFAESLSAWRPLRFVPSGLTQGALMAGAAACLWAHTADKTERLTASFQPGGRSTWFVLDQLRALQPAVKPGARIYVLNDPGPAFDTLFVIKLAYGDRSVQVFLDRYSHLPPREIETMDYVFTFENGAMKRLKPAG